MPWLGSLGLWKLQVTADLTGKKLVNLPMSWYGGHFLRRVIDIDGMFAPLTQTL